MVEPPTAQLLMARYAEPRTLRTRATGTPFRVVARHGQLVVIPGSGNERIVESAELREAWPLIASGASRTALKAVTNNASYLDAIFDDLETDGSVVAPLPSPDPAPKGVVDDRDLRSRLRHLKHELEVLARERDEARDRLEAIEREREGEEASRDTLQSTVRRLQSELLAANTAIREVSGRLKATEEKLAVATSQKPSGAGRLSLTIDEHVFDSKHEIRQDLWDILHEAGQLAFRFPHGSVAGSRRAIEAAVGYLWRQATGGIGTPKVSEMLDDLRGHRLMPTPDWHLAKNLYGRASAITHEGTKRSDLALWIFFGAVQICELVQPDATDSDDDA